MSSFAFMVKTILRPKALAAFLESLYPRYPNAPVWIADDSKTPYPEVADGYPNVTYNTFPYDIGIGHCYNWMLERIQEPYVVLCDDDFIFDDRTQIERFLPFLEADLFDLVGGAVWAPPRNTYQGFVGRFTQGNGGGVISESTINLEKIRVEDVLGEITPCEICMNFFAAKREVLQDVGWDPNLKVCRHEDWFLRFNGYRPKQEKMEGYRAAFYPGVVVVHDNKWYRNEEYMALRRGRFNGPEGRGGFVKKWGFEFV